MAHTHEIYDTDPHFIIDPITRQITNEQNKKLMVMQFDHNSEIYTFEIPKFVENHDMELCDKVQVHFINIERNGVTHNNGIYPVEDVKVIDDEKLAFSWSISQAGTQLVGQLNFLVKFICSNPSDNTKIDYEWNTAIYRGITVSDGLNNGEVLMKDYVDILEKWREEIEQMRIESRKYEVQEKHRPLSEQEVNSMFIKQNVNTLKVDDQTALRMMYFYPTFEEAIGQEVEQGFKFTHQGKLYKVIQAKLTIQEHFPPTQGTESLYARIDEEHDGDLYDPVPYDGNMALEQGKYYIQNGVVYRCHTSTVNPVYQDLKDLVAFVEVV